MSAIKAQPHLALPGHLRPYGSRLRSTLGYAVDDPTAHACLSYRGCRSLRCSTATLAFGCLGYRVRNRRTAARGPSRPLPGIQTPCTVLGHSSRAQ